MARKYFGTDGIRGRANGLITPELALKVGQAAGLRLMMAVVVDDDGFHAGAVSAGQSARQALNLGIGVSNQNGIRGNLSRMEHLAVIDLTSPTTTRRHGREEQEGPDSNVEGGSHVDGFIAHERCTAFRLECSALAIGHVTADRGTLSPAPRT